MPRDRFDDEDRYDERPRRRRRERDEDDRYDEDDRDRRGAEPPGNGPATTSMVLGILSFVGGITAIPGLICGFVGLSKAKKLGGAGKGMAITGTVLSGVGLIVLGLTVWLAIWLYGRNDERKTREVASNNLKLIGIAIHNQHDASGQFSTGVARAQNDFAARPLSESALTSKLSWRVEVLPYLEQGNVFNAMNLGEPWDSAANRRFADTPISQYSDPETRSDPTTRWRTFYGRGAPFDPNFPQRTTFGNITDGTSNTIMVAESGEKVTWSRFGEIKFDENNPPVPSIFGRAGKDTFQVLLFDGSVRNVRKTISPQTFKSAVTHAGGEVLAGDW